MGIRYEKLDPLASKERKILEDALRYNMFEFLGVRFVFDLVCLSPARKSKKRKGKKAKLSYLSRSAAGSGAAAKRVLGIDETLSIFPPLFGSCSSSSGAYYVTLTFAYSTRTHLLYVLY